MTIVRKDSLMRGREIDLTGPEGNAYVLMGYAQDFGRQLGMEDSIISILEEMRSKDYENLVAVFDREFGSFVTLLR